MPQTEKKRKRSKQIEVIILIADIENSSHIAESISAREYNKMLREYHRIAFRALDKYTPRIMEQRIVARRAYGDEILLLVQNKDPVETLSNVLSLAVYFEVEWSKSRFNTKRIHDHQTPCRLRLGVGHGKVILAESIWDQGMTPEGYAIATAKRIEAHAGGALNEPHILVAASLKPVLEQVKGIEISPSIIIPENKSKSIAAIEAIRLKSYEGLYKEFRQNIQSIDRFRKWFTRGYQALSAGDYKEGIKCLRLASESRPKSPNTLNDLGAALLYTGKLDEAEDIFEEVLRIQRDNNLALNNLGSILNRKKKYHDAELIFRKLTLKDPSGDIYFYNLGCALQRQDKYEEASDAFEKAIILSPKYVTALANLAEIRLDQERFIEADMLIKRALEIEPHNPGLIETVEMVDKARKAKALD